MMTIEDRKAMNSNIIQNIVLENRQRLNITGVLDVLSFDDQIIILETDLGLLNIKGENLKINKLSIDSSEVMVEGEVNSITYSDKDTNKKGDNSFLGKIFK